MPHSKRSFTEVQRQAQPGFQAILTFIQQSRFHALQAVNAELVALHWRIGEDLSRRILGEGWGEGTVKDLAAWIQAQEPGLRGFSASNLWKMRQFYEAYRGLEELAPLVRVLSWSHNLLIINKCKSTEERTFYLNLAARERWGKRELERQINGSLFEQSVLGRPKVSSALRVKHPLAEASFKDRPESRQVV